MRNICIIPARKGSKRIPSKNIASFCGKPMILRSLDLALESNLFNDIVVSTDCNLIGSLCETHASRPTIFMRDPMNATDIATTADVIKEVLDYDDMPYDRICCLYPCTPLLTVDKLKEGYNCLDHYTASMAVVQYSHPTCREFHVVDGSVLWLNKPTDMNLPTQAFVPTYHDAGQFYWVRNSRFEAFDNGFDMTQGIVAAVEIPELECQDIDSPEDFKLAEAKYKYLLELGLR